MKKVWVFIKFVIKHVRIDVRFLVFMLLLIKQLSKKILKSRKLSKLNCIISCFLALLQPTNNFNALNKNLYKLLLLISQNKRKLLSV